MKVKVLEYYVPRNDLKGKPVEVVHEFPGANIRENRALVTPQADGTVAEQELRFARECAERHFHATVEFAFEVVAKAPETKAAAAK